ncbi:hypothetical protein COL940_005886 [Colletotrichum noveboracense]|nr:hypothetical protein COL940_005886 [Colletotrichum noveboracense]KAJ0289918.1 hypothetical protein CBS470a_004131 [Colletotrichum nupharicola]
MKNESTSRIWFDTIGLWLEEDSSGPRFVEANTTIHESAGFSHRFINVTSFRSSDGLEDPTGILGLGTSVSYDADEYRKEVGFPPSILEQFVENKTITANSWFMHLGDCSAEQSSSLTLGGYERNRVLGPVGTFSLDPVGGMPNVFLIDVALGVEYGASPFPSGRKLGSVWDANNITGSDKKRLKELGGPLGSLTVLLDASFPYIYLPRRVCDAAAEYLPVYYDDALGLYVWNNTGELAQIGRIYGSPAYMSFTFSDILAENVTVKIPFRSLVLDVSPKRNGSRDDTKYWPCKPWKDPYGDEDDPWPLVAPWPFPFGRAFLQGAFTGYNYDRKKFYMGQAPGPDSGQRVLLDDDADTISSNPADSFADTWRRLWKEIESSDDEGVSGSTSPGDAPTDRGTYPGVVAGIAGAIGGGWWHLRHRRRQEEGQNAAGNSGDEYHAIGGKPELDGDGIPIAELHPDTAKRGPQVLAELHSPLRRDELEGESMVYEMPAGDVSPNPRQQPASLEKTDQSPQKPTVDIE